MATTKNYQEEIDNIVEEAVTQKTFSLDVIARIRDLKEAVTDLTTSLEKEHKQNEELLEANTGFSDLTSEQTAKIIALEGTIGQWKQREKGLEQREGAQQLVEQRAEFERSSREEIKELVSLVFRNPTFVRQTTKQDSVSTTQHNPTYATGSESHNSSEAVRESVE